MPQVGDRVPREAMPATDKELQDLERQFKNRGRLRLEQPQRLTRADLNGPHAGKRKGKQPR